MEPQDPQGLPGAEGDGELGREVGLLAAVVRQEGRAAAAGVAGVAGPGGIDRVGVEPGGDVGHGEEPDARRQRPVDAEQEAVEAEVVVGAHRPVGLVGGAAAPVVAAVAGGQVHQRGDRLSVARREAVGDE